jgi:hypothetical protein
MSPPSSGLNKPSKNKLATCFHANIFLGLFDPEDRGDMFLRKVVDFQRTTRISIRDSVVGIATSYELDDRGVGVRVPIGSIIFSPPRRPDRLWSPPNLQCVPVALSPGVKRPGREAHHSPPASDEVKKIWMCTSIPPYAFMM